MSSASSRDMFVSSEGGRRKFLSSSGVWLGEASLVVLWRLDWGVGFFGEEVVRRRVFLEGEEDGSFSLSLARWIAKGTRAKRRRAKTMSQVLLLFELDSDMV